MGVKELKVRLKRPHHHQNRFLDSPAKRKVVRAGRRGGKTTGIAILAVREFLAGRRVLYGAPTQEQVDAFWHEVKGALLEPLDAGIYYKNESLHVIEAPHTKQRIRAKSCWDADSLRGDFADVLILDEYQLVSENAWELVGAPMLLDNDGDAIFIYTPPSLSSRSRSKARDPRHAANLYRKAEADVSGRWAAFTFGSAGNPHISAAALEELSGDMTALAIRQEIYAEDVDEVPGALWSNALIEEQRKLDAARLVTMARIVVGVDPSGGGDEVGIVACGLGADGHGYVLADRSVAGAAGPRAWAMAAVTLAEELGADRIVAEKNFGGDMVRSTLAAVADELGASTPLRLVHASRGKAVRAEPVAALMEAGKAHHAGVFPALEGELTTWAPNDGWSPNRLDAKVWAMTDLMLAQGQRLTRAKAFSF